MTTSSNNSQMYNDIMASDSKDHPPMLAPGRYAQWQSHFLRYVAIPAKLATTTEEAVPEHNVPETYTNTTAEKRAYTDAEAEAIHMILSEIGDNIHTTVDACTCDNR
ncbi:hypothetical protein Tco_0235924 [Tanacetum coccineum]